MFRCRRWAKRIPVSFTSVSLFALLLTLPSRVAGGAPARGAEILFLPLPMRIE
jgi:hypothetical protein